MERSTDVRAGSVSYLARCLDLVDRISTAPREGLTLSQLAEATDLPVSTASRLARLLERRGLASRRVDKRFVPGPALVALGLRSLRLLPTEHYREAIQALGHSTGEGVSVGLLVDDEIVLVARHESEHRLRVVATIGDVIAPHTSAMGKAVLAHVPEARRHAILRRALGPLAAGVAEQLNAELELVATEGFARDEEVFAPGLRCRAAPLAGADGEAYGAISIAGPSFRFSRELAEGSVAELVRWARAVAGVEA